MSDGMSDVYVVGIGQTAVSEHWDLSLRDLAVESIIRSIKDAEIDKKSIGALYVGNMLAGETAEQEHLGALIADHAGLLPIDATHVESACSSGADAFRRAFLHIKSGETGCALACGVEQMTSVLTPKATVGLAGATDADYEVAHGFSFVAINALLAKRYLHENHIKYEDLALFPVNAHRNGISNPYAMYRKKISVKEVLKASLICDPITIFDSSPICDGSAACILMDEATLEKSSIPKDNCVRVLASACATDTLTLYDREDPLVLKGSKISAEKAYKIAKIEPKDMDFFELHDAFGIMSALSLEACGFAPKGEGWKLAKEGQIAIDGEIPICTMGGLKARGHPVGATGVYQIVECVEQLRGEAGKNQVKDAEIGMAQNFGGSGATVFTHIFRR
jgi:acetyl-CoA C-acetyltransferase